MAGSQGIGKVDRPAYKQAFKDYDKFFARFKGKAYLEYGCDKADTQRYLAMISSWFDLNVDEEGKSYDDFTEDYSTQQIKDAVYLADDAEEWQKFRVSLKGLDTKCKLWALSCYKQRHGDIALTRLRVNNYLGALKRGGQLSSCGRLLVLK